LALTAIAKAVGVTHKTLYHLRNEEGGPKENDLGAWEKFLEERAILTRDSNNEKFLPNDLKTLRKRLLKAQAGKEEAVRKLKELQLREKEQNLVPMSEAKAAVSRVLLPLRGLIDALPKAAAVAANPAEPIHAEEAIRECLDQVYRSMEAAADE